MKEQLKSNVISFMNGDKSAYEYIFKEEYAKVYSRIKVNIRYNNEKDIEDVVQVAFMKVYEKIDTLKDVNNFESWLMTIAINTAKNEVIKQNRTLFFEEIPDMDGATQEDFLENTYMDFQPEQVMIQKELEENLVDILSQIPPQQSMCLQMKEYDGLSYQEIADTLEIPLSSVKNNIFYAKKKIKAEVEARKLHSIAPVAFFFWMYGTYVEASEASIEVQNAAWLAQKNLLSSSGQMLATGATTVSKVVATETVKTVGKMTLAKTVAVVGTVAVLGIGGLGIAHTLKSNETNMIQEEMSTVEDGNDLETELTQEENKNDLENELIQEQEKNSVEDFSEQIAETETSEEKNSVPSSDDNQETVENLSIENVYVGSSVDASEHLYSIKNEKHFNTDQPVLHYTIAGIEKSMEYEGANIPGYGYEMGYELADVTGDGQEDLIVSIYCIGNTFCETLQNSYIYSIDSEKNDLVEILKIEAYGGETYTPGYLYNIGVYAEDNGIRLDTSSEVVFTQSKTVHLKYQDSQWIVESVNEFEGW